MDISGRSSALLPALLAAHGRRAVHVPGRTVNRRSGAYRGEAKTDARDASVIAETSRHRNDFAAIDVPARPAAGRALLTAHRPDVVADRVWMINRLRDVLTGVFPLLERAFASTALEAARAQQTALSGEDVAAQIVADLAAQGLALDDRLQGIDTLSRETFRSHAQGEAIESLSGMGPVPGAEFVVAAGDLSACADAGHLARAAGLVPVPRDSG